MEAGGLLPRQPAQGPPGVAPGTINVCAGQGPNGHAGNLPASTIHDLNAAAAAAAAAAGQLGIAGQQQLHLQQQQHLQQQHQQQHQQQQQMGQAPGMGEVLTPKRQAVVDRLRRRIESYRRRQTDCIPRFDQSFNGLCEQNIQDTLMLKQRFLESKAKRQPKKTDKKQSDPVGLSNVHVVSRVSFLPCASSATFFFPSSSCFLFFFFIFCCCCRPPSRRACVGVSTPLWEFELVAKSADLPFPGGVDGAR